jgi:hypothetical protein
MLPSPSLVCNAAAIASALASAGTCAALKQHLLGRDAPPYAPHLYKDWGFRRFSPPHRHNIEDGIVSQPT